MAKCLALNRLDFGGSQKKILKEPILRITLANAQKTEMVSQ
jgi:hypothetical protein